MGQLIVLSPTTLRTHRKKKQFLPRTQWCHWYGNFSGCNADALSSESADTAGYCPADGEPPEEILHLPKQTLEAGAPANLTLVDLNKEWIVDPNKLHSKARNAVFKQMQFRGKAVLTMTDGVIRYRDKD